MSIALPAGADDATAPANPAIPAQPAPSEPAPTDSAPSEPAPTEPAPAQPPARRAIVREALHDVAVQRTPEPPGGHHFPKLERVEVGGVPYYPYSFDGHVHSEHSLDADHPVVELLAGAERVGLSAVVLTDHGSARSALSFDKYKGPVRAFVGQEIGGEYGHAVWWNVDATLPSNARRATLAERAAYAHQHDGLIVLCHPGWWIGGRAQDPMGWITPEALRKGGISGDIDALELWNGVYDKPLPKLIAAWVEALEAGVYVPIVGNSDFHRFRSHRLGGPRNVVLCDTPELRSCLWSAVRAGRTYITDGPTLNLSVNGKTFGQQVAKAPLDVALNTFSPRAAELRLYVGRALAKTWPLQAGVQEQFRWSSAPPSTPTYLRVEIVRSLPGRDAPVFELLSNPVFVR